jgi:hypothetical protein
MILDAWEGNPWTACLATGWFGWCGMVVKNSAQPIPLLSQNIDASNHHRMTPKAWLQNHLNSLDTPNA